MSLDLFQDETQQALERLPSAPTPALEAPFFHNFIPGSMRVAAGELAKVGRSVSMAAAVPMIAADAMIGGTELQDRFFKQHDEVFGSAVKYWTPQPGEVGMAGEVVGALAGMLPTIIASPALAVGSQVLSQAEDLVDKGVPASKAVGVGVVQGAGLATGIWMPILGQNLWQRLVIGGAGFNVLQGATTRAGSQLILEGEKAAEMYGTFDPKLLTLDLVLGMHFGGFSHLSPAMREQGKGVWAKIANWAENLTPEQVDALAALRQAEHLNVETAPGILRTPEDVEANANRVKSALDSLLRDKAPQVDAMPKPRLEPDLPRQEAAEQRVAELLEEAPRVRAEEGLPELAPEAAPEIRGMPEAWADMAKLPPEEQPAAIGSAIERRLAELGVEQKEASANGAIWRAFFDTAAKKYGVQAAELMRDYGIDLQRMRASVPGADAALAGAAEGGYGGGRGRLEQAAGTRPEPEDLRRTVGGGDPAPGWIGATRISRAGRPLPVYRGAALELTAENFDPSALGVASGNPSSGLGVWFTTTRSEAATYGKVQEAYLDVRNPLVVKIEDLPGFDNPADATAWAAQHRAKGHDGLVITAKHLGGKTHVVAFDPKQVVPIGGHGEYAQGVKPGPMFYSELARQIQTAKMDVAPAKGWKDYIRGLAQKGVKADEVKWSGIEEWLDLQQGRVTRQQVSDFLEQNGVKVEEVMLGQNVARKDDIDVDVAVLRTTLEERGYSIVDDEVEEIFGLIRREDGGLFTETQGAELDERFAGPISDLPADVARDAYRYMELRDQQMDYTPVDGGVKFSQYTLPGAKPGSYRELLLTLPPKPQPKPEVSMKGWSVQTVDEHRFTGQRSIVIVDPAGNQVSQRSGFSGTDEQALADLAERMGESLAVDQQKTATFRSGHFDEPNILAHVRFNERTDADGKRVLFVEEFQSDWAQSGKKHSPTPNSPTNFETGMVPMAPFVGKTDAWVALALKRMIRYAAENNFDRVAWTTGEQQVSRYTSALRKQVDAIEWTKTPEGVQLVGYKGRPKMARSTQMELAGMRAAKQRGEALDAENEARLADLEQRIKGNKVVDTTEKETALSDAIGKAMADKILNDPNQSGSIEGDNIRIDDTGMASFYDRIVPNVANQILKKLGGGRVNTSKIGEQSSYSTETVYENDVPGFDLTDALRERALGGQTLFQRAFHGTRSIHDRFDLQKIGTGEGAQVYGWGLYFSSKKQVADWYRKALAGEPQPASLTIDGNPVDFTGWYQQQAPLVRDGIVELHGRMLWYKDGDTARARVREMLEGELKNLDTAKAEGRTFTGSPREDVRRHHNATAALHVLDNFDVGVRPPVKPGRTYEVEIPEPKDMIDWDKKALSQPKLIEAWRAFGVGEGDFADHPPVWMLGRDVYEAMVEQTRRFESEMQEWHYDRFGPPEDGAPRPTPEEMVSRWLNVERGIEGITYKGRTSGESNFVVFDDSKIQIQGYDQTNRGQINFRDGSTVIGLFEGANASTFAHESGHLFLQITRDLAMRADAPAAAVADWATLESWLGIEGGNIPVEAHEQFARGWEKYLAEGEAPTPELRTVFQQFRDWLLQVYRTLTELDVKLNDEIRGVMDRMLASEAADPTQARTRAPTEAEGAPAPTARAVPPPPRGEGGEARATPEALDEPDPWLQVADAKREEPVVTAPRGLDDQELRDMLLVMAEAEAGWAEIGGRHLGGELGQANFSSWVPRAEWWPKREGKLNEAQTREAVRKALAGEPLKKKEQLAIDYMVRIANERLQDVQAVGRDEWELTAEAATAEGMEPSTRNVVDTALVARAAQISEGALERLAVMYETDDAGFMAAVRRMIDAHHEEGRRIRQDLEAARRREAAGGGEERPGDPAAQGAAGPAGGARRPDVPDPGRAAGEPAQPAVGEAATQPDPMRQAAEDMVAADPERVITVGTNADGSPIRMTVAQYLAEARAQAELARQDVPLFEIAARCLLGGS